MDVFYHRQIIALPVVICERESALQKLLTLHLPDGFGAPPVNYGQVSPYRWHQSEYGRITHAQLSRWHRERELHQRVQRKKRETRNMVPELPIAAVTIGPVAFIVPGQPVRSVDFLELPYPHNDIDHLISVEYLEYGDYVQGAFAYPAVCNDWRSQLGRAQAKKLHNEWCDTWDELSDPILNDFSMVWLQWYTRFHL